MQHKFLLRFIKQEMQREKIDFKNNEAFFRLFLTDEPWESYRSNMSNWLSSSSKDGVIHKHHFITAINEKLGLSSEIWGASDEKQKEAVVRGVKQFKELQEKEELLFPWVDEVGLTKGQEAFIYFAQTASVDEVEKMLDTVHESFTKRSHTQAFLITLLEVMYERGAYDFVYEHIFPYLLDTYDNSIKAKKAHIYASLPKPMYREAFDILNSIKGESQTLTMDLQTSAISNIRRERFSSLSLTKQELQGLLQTLIKCYSKIYMPKEPQSYYMGINLAYMLTLAHAVFPDNVEIDEGYSVEQIYKDVQKSIAKAKESENLEEQYYASMSEIEFQLLLGKKEMTQALEYMLESLNPSTNLIDQTSRQMGLFFMDVVEKFAEKTPKNLHEFKYFLDVFDTYALSRKAL
jgi:hypothetical protein